METFWRMYVNAKLRKILHETVLSYFKWLDPFRNPERMEKSWDVPPSLRKGKKRFTNLYVNLVHFSHGA